MQVWCTKYEYNSIKEKARGERNADLAKHKKMEFIDSTLTLVTHNTVFNVELSNDNHVADPFLKRLIAEFNHQQHSPSADVAKTAVTLKRDTLLLLAWNTNVLEKRVTMEIFYEPVTLLRT